MNTVYKITRYIQFLLLRYYYFFLHRSRELEIEIEVNCRMALRIGLRQAIHISAVRHCVEDHITQNRSAKHNIDCIWIYISIYNLFHENQSAKQNQKCNYIFFFVRVFLLIFHLLFVGLRTICIYIQRARTRRKTVSITTYCIYMGMGVCVCKLLCWHCEIQSTSYKGKII